GRIKIEQFEKVLDLPPAWNVEIDRPVELLASIPRAAIRRMNLGGADALVRPGAASSRALLGRGGRTRASAPPRAQPLRHRRDAQTFPPPSRPGRVGCQGFPAI